MPHTRETGSVVAVILILACLLPRLTFGEIAAIGSALSDGLVLVYQSGGNDQPPWVYDSVRVVEREGFDRCVRIARRDQPERETCVRDDTLFDRSDAGQYRALRPIGPNMRLDVKGASGQLAVYETGPSASRRVGDLEIAYLETTITTRNAEGVIVRRLREEYAPALLTALRGEFEEPDGDGWRTVQEFSLSRIQR